MKSGPISTVGGIVNPAPLDAAIVPPIENTYSLASLADKIMAGADGLVCILVDFANRKVRAKAAVEGVATDPIDSEGAVGVESFLTFVKADQTTKSSPWALEGATVFAVTGGDDEPWQDVAQKPTAPVLSTAQLLGRFEDETLDAESDNYGANIVAVVDQGSGKITLVSFATAANAAAAVAAAGPFTIAYDQTIAATGAASRQPLE